MLQRFLAMVLGLLAAMVYAAPVSAAAASLSGTVTLSGVVLPARYIYLDNSGDIKTVVGNTSQNLVPTVLDSRHRIVPLTAKVSSQYQQLLAENGGRLRASQYYLSDKYNPYVLFACWVATNPYFSQKII